MYRIIERISDTLPVIGGATGAVTQASNVVGDTGCIISMETVLQTIVIATIGAVVGYIVKLGLNAIMKKIKHLRNE